MDPSLVMELPADVPSLTTHSLKVVTPEGAVVSFFPNSQNTSYRENELWTDGHREIIAWFVHEVKKLI